MVTGEYYRSKLTLLRYVLIQKWCMLEYCHLFDGNNSELRKHVEDIKEVITSLKCVNVQESPEQTKKDLTYKVLVYLFGYNVPDIVYRDVKDMFTLNGVDDINQIREVSESLSKNIEGLVDVISDKSISLNDYIIETFSDEE